jgi:hypothetical protein
MQEQCNFIIQPYASSKAPVVSNTYSLNYTNQDFYSLKLRLLQYVRENFSTKFNDFVESSLAIMLIENFSFIGDMLSFKTDQVANEVFIDTVSELSNAFRIAEQVGFVPTPPIGSKAMFSAKLSAIQSYDVVIPTPYQIVVSNNDITVPFELFPADALNQPILDEDIVIKAGKIINSNVVGVQGQTFQQTYSGTGDSNQNIPLTYYPVINQSVRVFIDGTQWEQVKFFSSGSGKMQFRVQYNADYSATVIFGNTQGGMIPNRASVINVIYRVGGGPVGDIISNYANTQALISISGLPYAVPVDLTNYTSGKNGYSGDTIDDIRNKLPRYLSTQERCVTADDYKTFADTFATPYNGTVGKSTVALRTYGCAANVVDLYVLARSGTDGLIVANPQFKYLLLQYINNYKMLTDYVVIKDGEVKYVNVSITAFVSSSYAKFETEIRNQIITQINNFFSLANWEYGQTLKSIDILQALNNISEPKSYDISFDVVSTTAVESLPEVTAEYYQIIRPNPPTLVKITFI